MHLMGSKETFDGLIVPNGGSRFSGDDFRLMGGPIVYCFLRQNTPLYVGMSKAGLSRPGARVHKQAETARRECDEVLIFPVRNAADASKLERLLISVFRPEYNRQRPHLSEVAERLGLNIRSLGRTGFSFPSTAE